MSAVPDESNDQREIVQDYEQNGLRGGDRTGFESMEDSDIEAPAEGEQDTEPYFEFKDVSPPSPMDSPKEKRRKIIEAEQDEDDIAARKRVDDRINARYLQAVELKKAGEEREQAIRDTTPDLVQRAKALVNADAFNFPDMLPKVVQGQLTTINKPTDMNRWHVLDVMFGKDSGPHLNLFKGRLVDQDGTIVDKFYPIIDVVRYTQAAGLKEQSADAMRSAYREWALKRRYNDLTIAFEKAIPEWDGTPRASRKIIELFKPHPTPLLERFGLYFWLSLYNRITNPGCQAPIVLALFGAQNAGKSYFAKLICRVLMQDDEATVAKMDLSKPFNNTLRDITGNSIIANVAEMSGFNRSDLNKIKDIVTTTEDLMDHKYEGTVVQKRQWITIMDGNEYDGLQRDSTGNRRFYPLFVGQIEDDEEGKPQWLPKFEADFTNFREDIWQIMAECRAWMAENGGMAGYDRYVDSVVREVAEFNAEEIRRGRGKVTHRATATYFPAALHKANKRFVTSRAGRDGSRKPDRIVIGQAELHSVMHSVSRAPVVGEAIEDRVVVLGGKKVKGNGEPVTYQWDYVAHPDSETAKKFAKRREGLTMKDNKDALCAIYIDEFMTSKFGEDYKELLEVSAKGF